MKAGKAPQMTDKDMCYHAARYGYKYALYVIVDGEERLHSFYNTQGVARNAGKDIFLYSGRFTVVLPLEIK